MIPMSFFISVTKVIILIVLVSISSISFCQQANFTNQVVSSGWNDIVGFTWDSTGQQYVWEKAGKVWVVDTNGVKIAIPLINISDEVGSWRDHGLNGLALDPNFLNNGFIYLFYTVDRHHLINFGTASYNPATNEYFEATIARVTRFTCDVSTNFTTIVPGSRFILIGETKKTGIPILHESHSGGSLVFGTDGSLFVSTGEGGSYSFIDGGNGTTYWSQALADSIISPKENVGAFRAQLVDCLNGKILRIDPSTGDGLMSNPYFDFNNPRRPQSRVWALGLRNPFRMTLRPGTGEQDITAGYPGTLYIGDVGWDTWEELNINNAPKQNFGWPLYEGLTPHIGYQNAIVYNQDAPNPLFGTGACANPYFEFKALLKQATLDPDPFFYNPCDSSQEVPPTSQTFIHVRPIIDWKHGNQSRTGIYDGINADEINISDSLSPVSGPSFGGYASVGGIWYDDNRFPVEWQNTYFHADYVGQWVRNFSTDTLDQPIQVKDFWDNNGVIVYLALNRKNGCIAYADYPNQIKEICYGGVVNNLPTAVLSSDLYFGVAPLSVQFTGSNSTDPENLPLSYYWEFGDGNTSNQPDPQHIYNPGTSFPTSYFAKLTVTDNIGQTDKDSILISVNNTPPQVQIISFNDGDLYSMSGFTNLNLEALVTDAEHSSGELFYEWRTILHHNAHTHIEEIDTNKVTTTVISPIGCEVLNTYFFRISLKVTDAAGLSTMVDASIYPACDPPVTNVVVSDSVICEGETVNFTDLSTNFPVQWEWNFPGGNPATSSDQNPVVVYNVPGLYDVQLIASSFQGSDTLLLTNYISVGTIPLVDLGSDSIWCGAVLLDAGNPGASYLWNDGTSFQFLNVSNSGNYSVLVTDVSGCESTDSISVVINTIPVFTLGADTIQCGGTITLSGPVNVQSYLWQDGSVGSQHVAVQSGMYSLAVIDSNGCEYSDTIEVVINTIPVFTLGADTVQCGGTITLSGPPNVQSYLWQDGSVGSQYVAVQSGMYSLTVIDSNGCEFSDTIKVSINDLPVVSLGADVEVCDTLYTIHSGLTGPGLLWSDGTSGSSITVSISGTYFLQVTDSNLCSFTDTIGISLLLPVQATFTPNFNDTICTTTSSFVISGGSPAGGNYFVNGILTTVIDPAVLGSGLHFVSYIYTESNGCSDTAGVYLLIEVCSGIASEIPLSEIIVFPNPANDEITIVFGNNFKSNIVKLFLYDQLGRLVLKDEFDDIKTRSYELTTLSEGIYFLDIQCDTQNYRSKVVIAR